jgi:uncharacterized protein YecT (DUF1311 family)
MSRLARHGVWIAAALALSSYTAAALPLLTKAHIAKAAVKIEACLDKQYQANHGKAARCIGSIKDDCEGKISAGGEAAHATCSDDETAAWDALLNKAWSELPADLGPERFAVMKDIQKQWLAYRDAKCAFLDDPTRPSAWGIMLEADCRMDETSRRTIELRDILADPHIGLPE